jgi:hypothetical protein
VIKLEGEMGRACKTYGKKGNTYRVLVAKPGGRGLVGRPRLKRDDNIKIDI